MDPTLEAIYTKYVNMQMEAEEGMDEVLAKVRRTHERCLPVAIASDGVLPIEVARRGSRVDALVSKTFVRWEVFFQMGATHP